MFYDRFLELCRQKGVSPAAAAREMGFSNATTTQWSHGSIPSKASLSKISTYFDVSTEYLKTGIGTAATSETHSPDNSAPIEPDTFQFERFVHLCKQQGKMQSHLYDLVGLPSKAGSNLKRTKKVKPEILEVWAAELNTSAEYLNGDSLHTDRSGRTDKLLKDPAAFQAVCELLYQYGKYLMISGSRRGGQPLNLQGQWNANIRPAWSSNYTVNINTQMNYWGASLCGLQECLEPYLRMVHEVCKRGEKTAKVNYGCRGFACNHNVDLWRKTAPVIGESNYMYAPLCGVWLANEIYEHYLNGGLDAERDTVLEIVRQAALFIMDYLVEHDGCYVSCPSASPEAVFDRNGRCALGLHSAFENGLARQALMNAASIVEEPSERTKIQNTLDHLQPFEYAQEGLSEWSGGISCSEKGHRHFSPLYALYPGRVAGAKDPELLFQMRKLFDCRQANSKGQIGWSTAWAICLAGRFHDGATAQKNIQLLIDKALFRNLFNVHWPAIFQIDGNFGYVAGVNECLIGYQDGVIELLPALPPDWREGKMNGAQIRGARISFSWKNGQVTQVSSDREIILSGKNLAKNCRIGELIRLKEGT